MRPIAQNPPDGCARESGAGISRACQQPVLPEQMRQRDATQTAAEAPQEFPARPCEISGAGLRNSVPRRDELCESLDPPSTHSVRASWNRALRTYAMASIVLHASSLPSVHKHELVAIQNHATEICQPVFAEVSGEFRQFGRSRRPVERQFVSAP